MTNSYPTLVEAPQPRLYYLDVMRGLASLSVAFFWHYQHFSPSFQPDSLGDTPPYFVLFKIFYTNGNLMVDLFFVLSGIVFTYNYQASVASKAVGGNDFFTKRFSRLYPIHFFTLLTTACIVYYYYDHFGVFPIYKVNDAYHFFLNLVFLQKGFFDAGESFNGPAWSLSIEILMYSLFFIQARYLKSLPSAVFLILLGLAFFVSGVNYSFLLNDAVARGLIGFFSGCLLHELLLKQNARQAIIVAGLIGVCYAVYLIGFRKTLVIPLNLQLLITSFIFIPILHHSRLVNRLANNRFLLSIGDSSLAIYMVHIPIQMALLTYFKITYLPIHYDSKGLFFGYCVLVLLIGYLIHYYFERPVQNWIRLALKAKKPG